MTGGNIEYRRTSSLIVAMEPETGERWIVIRFAMWLSGAGPGLLVCEARVGTPFGTANLKGTPAARAYLIIVSIRLVDYHWVGRSTVSVVRPRPPESASLLDAAWQYLHSPRPLSAYEPDSNRARAAARCTRRTSLTTTVVEAFALGGGRLQLCSCKNPILGSLGDSVGAPHWSCPLSYWERLGR